jgi:lambda repressor-like predicted transcriptional regulator
MRVCADARGELAAESSRAIGLLDTRLREQAARRYAAGETLRQIAKGIGVGRERLGATLRADGVQTRRRAVPPELVPEFVRRYLAGESLAALSARFGWSPGTIRARIIEMGCAMRDQQARPAS